MIPSINGLEQGTGNRLLKCLVYKKSVYSRNYMLFPEIFWPRNNFCSHLVYNEISFVCNFCVVGFFESTCIKIICISCLNILENYAYQVDTWYWRIRKKILHTSWCFFTISDHLCIVLACFPLDSHAFFSKILSTNKQYHVNLWKYSVGWTSTTLPITNRIFHTKW